MSCVKCTPNENTTCEDIPSEFATTECAPTVLGYLNGCYTHVKDNKVQRGCLLEAPEHIQEECNDLSNESSTICSESDCNRERVYIGDYCYECDSNTDKNCIAKVDSYMEKKCNDTRSGCYLIRPIRSKNSKSKYSRH